MSKILNGPLVEDVLLTANWQIVLRAVDATTGADVAGVNVSQIAFLAESGDTQGAGGAPAGPFLLVPGPGE